MVTGEILKTKRLAKKRVGLMDSFGAWTMTDREEEEIFSSLKMNWKRTTIAIRKRANNHPV